MFASTVVVLLYEVSRYMAWDWILNEFVLLLVSSSLVTL
jgi:hypothetical protein